jgi:hypothetical protein
LKNPKTLKKRFLDDENKNIKNILPEDFLKNFEKIEEQNSLKKQKFPSLTKIDKVTLINFFFFIIQI